MQLTNAQIVSIAEAHLNLDGSPEKPFVFGSKFRYSLSKNLRLLQQHVRDLDKTRVELIRALAPTTLKIEKDAPERGVFDAQYTVLLGELADVPHLMHLKLSELNLAENAIPIRVLSALGPIIIEDSELS